MGNTITKSILISNRFQKSYSVKITNVKNPAEKEIAGHDPKFFIHYYCIFFFGGGGGGGAGTNNNILISQVFYT